jgi:predicted RND superfamily exporter protein
MERETLSQLRERWLASLLQRPGAACVAVAALTLGLGSGLLRLDLRTDGAAIHPLDNVTVQQTLADRDTFHDADQAIVLLTSRRARPGLASASLESDRGFQRIARLQRALESLPSVDGARVRSLATLLDPDPTIAIVDIEPFLDHVPSSLTDDSAWIARLREFPLTRGLFLSTSGAAAAFTVPVAAGHSRDEFISDLETWTAANRDADFDLRLTGPVAAEVMLGRAVLRDLLWLVPIMVAVIALLLFLSLRTLGGVVIPLAEVVMVLLWTLGAMGHLGVPITLVTTILPIVLMTMAVTDEVHLLERFQARLAAEPAEDAAPDDSIRKRRAMHGAIGDVGRPIVLTSLTTAIGFLSFLSASMDPIRHFGLFAAIGIVIAMLLSFSFVPALAMLLPAAYFETRGPASSRGPDPPGTRLPPHEKLLIRRPRAAALGAAALVLVALPGLARLTVQDSWVDNFDPASDLVSAERDFNAEFWGSYRLDITLHSDQIRFFQYHDGLALMEKVRATALAGAHVAGVESHLIAFETVAKAIGEPGALSALPHSVILRIVVLVWTVREAIGLDQVLAWGGQSARARLYVDSADHARGEALRDYLERELPSIVEPFGVRYHLGGELAVATEVVGSIVSNQIRSIAWALLGVALLLWLTLRSAATAALVIAPLAAALLTLLGAMGTLDVSLGIATSMFSALALGVGVDFAVHFHHAYDRERRTGSGHEAALAESLRTSGRAIRWNATVLSLGFLVLTASALKPNHSLGVLLSAAIAACYAMTLLLLPSLLRRARSREFRPSQ